MTLTFEDFPPGHFGRFGPRRVTREEMLAFAAEFDPQPMHLRRSGREAVDAAGAFRRGWHLCSIMMRMMVDGFIGRTGSLGSPGVNEFAGSRRFAPETNSRSTSMWRRQGFAQPPRHRHRDVQERRAQRGGQACARWSRRSSCSAARRRGGAGGLMHFFRTSDRAAGEVGSFHLHHRADQEICRAIRFRSAFISTREGRKSLFGGLAGVGLARRVGVHEASGYRWPASGQEGSRARREGWRPGDPSPGFRELRWIKPVLAGDTISFASEVESLRPSRSAPSGASCRPATPAPTSSAKLVFSLLATRLCRGGTPAPETCAECPMEQSSANAF